MRTLWVRVGLVAGVCYARLSYVKAQYSRNPPQAVDMPIHRKQCKTLQSLKRRVRQLTAVRLRGMFCYLAPVVRGAYGCARCRVQEWRCASVE